MYEVDSNGSAHWLNPDEELGVLRLLVPRLHEKIAEQRAEIERLKADKATLPA